MPSLIVSSRYTTDSQILRRTAQGLGWETLRLDGVQVPDWFDPKGDSLALFYTAPHAFEVARQLSRVLLGCHAEWMLRLPAPFVLRDVRQMSLDAAMRLSGRWFVKHAVTKAFPAGIYDSASLTEATARLLPGSLVHVAQPVQWDAEYRCFVLERDVATISAYQRRGRVIEGHAQLPEGDDEELSAAEEFAAQVLAYSEVDCPPAFVMDVGMIHDRGWAVVEVNECWASGIYACDPEKVLATLLRACVPVDQMTDTERPWNFQEHYAAACP